MIKRIFKWLGILLLVLAIVYLLGPTPPSPVLDTTLPKVTNNLTQLEQEVIVKEKKVKDLRPDNEARIVWADSAKKQKTPYALVYLHGFSATWAEGEPVHRNFARRYGCNLYLARLAKHGIGNQEAFENLTVDQLLTSAKEALAIAQRLGEQVIIMATSTGATLGLYLAAHHPKLAGIILYSPLIDFYSPALYLLNKPWGLQVARLVFDSKYYDFTGESNQKKRQYWTTRYRFEGTVALKSLVANTMDNGLFAKIKQPLFLGYYYKDETHQDKVVSVKAMKQMYTQLGTPSYQKRQVAFPNVGSHVIASYITSKNYQRVAQKTFEFAEEVLKLKPVEK
ncbi:alpha/beta hydrolase [uncultured Microscilla sp.]|uniref:alpha/beta hydrolase n=1 Tax=uncultured Microscilla sp. TaxID=432653 RepID=UPI002631FFA7|nr:alpha/beta hydrolase [uncultured Microscilla sp.]